MGMVTLAADMVRTALMADMADLGMAVLVRTGTAMGLSSKPLAYTRTGSSFSSS